MNFRYDIQALRGFAVLIVLLYHASLGPFKAGYLGVDIFFVISGFLITSLLVKQMNAGNFSFIDFYYRRAKRLLPTAYLVLLLTLIGSYFFLTAGNFDDFRKQFINSITFTANVALFKQTGYFESSAELKPLLHMWSLAIEEQFYFVLPVTLFFVPRKFWKVGALVGVAISLLLCVYWVQKNNEAAFFLLPFRAWELGIGCLVALYVHNSYATKTSQILLIPAILLLFLIPIFPFSENHPGTDALLICIATAIIILANNKILNQRRYFNPLIKVGNISYTLYLVHWPLFAFANSAYLGMEAPTVVRIALLALSFGLAVIIYYTVEKPIHCRKFAKRRNLVFPLFGISIILCVSIIATSQYIDDQSKQYVDIRRHNFGLDIDCSIDGSFRFVEKCRTTKNAKFFIWGDSYAMHIIPGVTSQTNDGVIQITKNACSPVINYSRLSRGREWAEECINFHRDAYNFLKQNTSIEYVLLASPFQSITDGRNLGLYYKDSHYQEVHTDVSTTIIAFRKTIETIRDAGKKVVVISPPPKANYNIGECLERKVSGKILVNNPYCTLNMSDVREQYKDVYDFLDRLPTEVGLNVIYLSDYLCRDDQCMTMFEDGTFVYRDEGHLTVEGSKKLFEDYNILEDIKNKAY